MERTATDYNLHLDHLVKVTSREGSLLVTQQPGGKPNVMTIGWLTAGFVWGRPMMCVMVRPSRYSFGIINSSWEFTVNVMPYTMLRQVAYCGRVSGRDDDKFASQGFTAKLGSAIHTSYIDESVIHFECKVLYSHDLPDNALGGELDKRYYPDGDYHRVYYGEIVQCMAVENAAQLIEKA